MNIQRMTETTFLHYIAKYVTKPEKPGTVVRKTATPPSLCAAQLPLPAFAGEELPPPRVSPQVRNAWVVALAELERRDEKRRQSALVAEGAGVGLAVTIGTGVLVAGACCVQ